MGGGRGGEALAVEPSHFSTGSDATADNDLLKQSTLNSLRSRSIRPMPDGVQIFRYRRVAR